MNFVKTPPPRPLSQKETLDSLNHWKTLFQNFYRRDASFKSFLATDCKCDFKKKNYAFLPDSYLTERILEDSKCLQDCWDMIYEHCNVQIPPETLLDFEKLKRSQQRTTDSSMKDFSSTRDSILLLSELKSRMFWMRRLTPCPCPWWTTWPCNGWERSIPAH